MVTGIYVSALAPESGKSLICLGLADTLHRHADRVGFFRPIVEGLGADHDPMILMLRHMYGLDPSVCLGGITLSAALGLLGAGRCDEIFGDAVVKYGQIAKQCDVVIVEGSGLRGHDDAAEFDLNARLANNLGLAVLAVVGAKGLSPEETADAVDVARKELASMRCSLLSVMVNRRRRRGRRHPCRLATRCPQASGLRHSGDPRDFAAHGGWRLGRASFGPVAGSTELDRDVGQVIVAAMNVGNFLSGLGTGDLVIVPGDRADVMVACLASALSPQFPTPSAMIMTKGLAANARAREIMLEGAYFGTMMVQLGEADGMVSGASHTTANTIRPALEFVKTRDGVRTVSSVFFMLVYWFTGTALSFRSRRSRSLLTSPSHLPTPLHSLAWSPGSPCCPTPQGVQAQAAQWTKCAALPPWSRQPAWTFPLRGRSSMTPPWMPPSPTSSCPHPRKLAKQRFSSSLT